MDTKAVKDKIRNNYHEILSLCFDFITREELILLRKAYEVVVDQFREDFLQKGDEYINHSIEVAKIVISELGLQTNTVVCALLHNLLGEGRLSEEDLRKIFGEEIARITVEYNRISDLQTTRIAVNSENFRKLYLSMVSDIRVILLKLAHRLYDIRNFKRLSPEKKERFIDEIHFIYIPIAHRLGLYHIKTEMEELWMKYTHEEKFMEISEKISESKAKQNVYIEEFIRPIERELLKQGFDFEIKGRSKSIYSIWRKMIQQKVGFEEVYDLFAIRIIINSEMKNEKLDCWKVYSIVTEHYMPNPNRLRDWISTPKASGYESLHTTVVGPNGKWVEVQIRTRRMDEEAEQGLASHWRYKEAADVSEQEEWLGKIRDVIENPETDSLEKSSQAKLDLYSDNIFVFTPEGDLKKLPANATVLDFAYEIHSGLGDLCSGARVNNKVVPIRHVLANGDKVEVIISKNQKPKQDWLNFVTTSKARSRIRKALKEEKYRKAEIGKGMLERKLRNKKIELTDELADRIARQLKLKVPLDLYYHVALEKVDLSEIVKFLTMDQETETRNQPEQSRPVEPAEAEEKKAPDLAKISGNIDQVNYKFAKCCNPVAGDDVFGFITIGSGITVHRNDCPNAARLKTLFAYRVIDVQLEQAMENVSYQTCIRVSGDDVLGILNDITFVISRDHKVNISSVSIESKPGERFIGQFRVSIRNTKQLFGLLKALRKVKGVKKVTQIDLPDQTEEK